MIKRLLIANRGEIAVRIIRTAREMGIETVAVYSDADAGGLHTRLADQAVHLGASEPARSYLSTEAILAAARSTGADAIHPGYGFLSERDAFADAVTAAGLVFVGPSGDAMRRLGSKIGAKQLAQECGVPLTPGVFRPSMSDADLAAAARELGLPVMLKASAGGGGRGMRAVFDEGDLESQIRLAKDEALKGFGDDSMMVEKLIERPRHIEVQVVADSHGGVACLFERECSVQRRHQKLIEEAPSSAMTPELWERMKGAAASLIRAAGYVGAATVEFITDAHARDFYFMEVNARLQVEHPVTEEITGLDLVRQQLLVASGLPLDVPQWALEGSRDGIRGHSIEVRIVTEDPAHGFLPSSGQILGWAPPHGKGIRWDSGFEAGSTISRFYDSLAAKLIVWGATREEAINRAISALKDTHILGIKTNIAHSIEILDSDWFRSGRLDTGALEREMPSWSPPEAPALLGSLASFASPGAGTPQERRGNWAWDIKDGFRNVRSSL